MNPLRLKMDVWVIILGGWLISWEHRQSVTSRGKSKLILCEFGSATGMLVDSRRRLGGKSGLILCEIGVRGLLLVCTLIQSRGSLFGDKGVLSTAGARGQGHS